MVSLKACDVIKSTTVLVEVDETRQKRGNFQFPHSQTKPTMQTQRLLKEYRSAGKVAIDNRDDMIYQLGPITDVDLTEWTAIIRGPPDTPYSGGLFTLDISISQNYPLEPPIILFRTKIFHPNVHWKVTNCKNIYQTIRLEKFVLIS